MAEKKFIDVEVRETGLDELNEGLKETEKQVDKTGKSVDDVVGNGGAIAVLDQMTGGLATQFKNLYESTRLFNVSLKGTRTALLATGIGAFVVAAGLLVAYWDDIVDFIEDANRKLREQQILIESQLGIWNAEDGLLQAQIKAAEAEGKSVEHLKDKQKALFNIRIERQKAYLENLKQQVDEEEQDAKRLTTWEKIAGLYSYVMYGAKTEGQVTTEEEGGINTLLQKITEAETALVNLGIQMDLLDKKESEKEADKKGGASAQRGADQEKVSPLTGLPLSEIETTLIQENDLIEKFAEQRKSIAKTTKEFNILMAREEAMAKADVLMQFGGFLQQLGEDNKALLIAGLVAEQIGSISQIISATGVANAKAVAASPLTFGQPWVGINTISAGISIASGIAGAAKAISGIRGANENSGFSGFSPSGGGASGGGGTQNAIRQPDFNIVGQSGINQLSEVIAERERQPIRAYVVSQDVRTQAELDRRIERTASIG